MALILISTSSATLNVLAATETLNTNQTSKENPKTYSYVRSNGHIYVRIEKSEFEALEKNSIGLGTILQRLAELERLYLQIKAVIDGIDTTVKFIKKIMNIADSDIFKPSQETSSFKDKSGVVMAPGYVEFSAKLTNANKTFEEVFPDNVLDMDIYYDKTLFAIDHIEGKGVLGNKFTKIPLSQSLGATRDRIKLPISDALKNEVSFKVFLTALNPLTIEVGDSSKITARYSKTVKLGETTPISYKLAENSSSTIKVIDIP